MNNPYLGIKARELDVVFQADATWDSGVQRSTGDWAITDHVELRFGNGDIWPATLTDDLASWHKTKVEVNALLAADPGRVELWYRTDGGAEVRWTRGNVLVQS